MFGWLKKITGGARVSVAPPVSRQGPLPPAADLSDAGARACAPLVFRKPANIDPFSSMFGMVRLSKRDEVWPALNGVPLTPLLQINLMQAPVVPVALRDLSLITLFISEQHSNVPTQIIDSSNPADGATWALRSYATLEGLTIPKPPVIKTQLRPLLGEWPIPVSEPRPDYENTKPVGVITTVIDGVEHYSLPKTRSPRTKVGGWPEATRVMPWWVNGELVDTWDFVMQIVSEPNAGWAGWGGGGAYIARSRERPHLWAIDVQFS